MVLTRACPQHLPRFRGWQRTDSAHILAAVRARSRRERMGKTLRHALDSLAVAAPDWLHVQVRPAWGERTGQRIEDADLPKG